MRAPWTWPRWWRARTRSSAGCARRNTSISRTPTTSSSCTATRTSWTVPPSKSTGDATVASAGLTEAEAQAQGQQTDARVLELAAIPRAIVSRSTRGLVKLVAEQGAGRLLGVHLLADGAGDAILAAVYAIGAGMTVQQMADAWNPYLTIGEAVHLTAQSFTRDPAALSCCA